MNLSVSWSVLWVSSKLIKRKFQQLHLRSSVPQFYLLILFIEVKMRPIFNFRLFPKIPFFYDENRIRKIKEIVFRFWVWNILDAGFNSCTAWKHVIQVLNNLPFFFSVCFSCDGIGCGERHPAKKSSIIHTQSISIEYFFPSSRTGDRKTNLLFNEMEPVMLWIFLERWSWSPDLAKGVTWEDLPWIFDAVIEGLKPLCNWWV